MRTAGENVLVRHADSVPPVAGGPDDPRRPLSAAGVVAAAGLVGTVPRPTAVFSSPYRRAVQTVEPIAAAEGLAVQTRWDLREWDSGLAPSPDYAVHYAASWADPSFARDGGESLDALTARAVAAVTELAAAGGLIVVGSHGTFVARLLAGLGVVVDWPFSRDMPMPAVYRVRLGRTPSVLGL